MSSFFRSQTFVRRGRFITRESDFDAARRPPQAFLFLIFMLILMTFALPSRTAAAHASRPENREVDSSLLPGVGSMVVDGGEILEVPAVLVPPCARETSEAFRYTDQGLLASPWAFESGAFSG